MIALRIPAVLFLATLPLAAQQRARALGPADAHETTARIELFELGRSVLDVRRPLANGRVERRTIDAATGAHVDLDALRRADFAAGLSRRSGMHTTLHERVQSAAPTERLQVAFWLVEPADGFDARRLIRERVAGLAVDRVSDAIRTARVEARLANRDRLAATVDTFTDRARGAGAEVLFAGGGWPLVIAEVPAERVAQLSSDPRVDAAYVSQREWAHEGEYAQGTMRTRNVHDQGGLADGSVRVLVNDTAQVQVGNVFLPPITTLNSSGVGSHATGVAGNIGNIHPLHRAAAFSLPEIFSAGGTGDVTAPPIWEDAIDNGIDMGNCSWWNFLKGKIEFLDRFFDYTVRNFSVMMFKSNGNQGTSGTPYGTTPGNGYNVTCSGAYSDGNDFDWANDAMASSSSYWNPEEGHDKPEVASPGTCVTTAGTAGSGLQSCFGGTSSASPLTCGLAAVLASVDNTLLAQMTTLKAALMVSAWHDVEGTTLVSEKDGAGGIHSKAAHALVRDQQWWYDDVEASDFPGGLLDVPIELVAGQETRVIALWFSAADEAYTTDVLELDVDLVVLGPGGLPLASSASALNPFELASFVAPTSGTYTARLTLQRFDGTVEPLTVAWSTKNDAGTAQIRLREEGDDFAIGQAPTFEVGDRWIGAGAGYRLWLALDGSAGTSPLANGFVLPLEFDGLSVSSQAFPGFNGTLPATGMARIQLHIPDDPGLVGTEVHFGMVVFDTTFVSVEDADHSFVIGT